MADGKTHFRVSLVLDCIGIPIALSSQTEFGAGVAIGLLVGTISTPDVRDIEGKTYPVYILSRVPLIGKLLAWSLRVVWAPLSLALPHRSRLSHMPVLGTLVAVAYVFVWIALIGLLTSSFTVVDLVRLFSTPLAVGIFFGWLFQDLSHLLFDR